ncbi:polyketide cyclase / dehydrase and lipid transport family protein [Mycobacterium ulcerans str. Harvey]|uniref:Polyketide cyclase / dehydrase and lipid transport family protein n=1 Tax=Mycobacterium ulcerans str. Harvey TaxID=1299332 RepID=A0ABN0QTN6_MYCUL|nr:polyketide cyclase / dehydrase and lipid transport family protein [Mycobacterium ulcerans str. Harvey]
MLNEGPDGEPVGTTRRVQVGRNTLVERITAFDPPTSLAYDIEGLPNRLRKVANHWRLRRSGNATIVDLTSTVEVGTSRLAQMAERVALRVLAQQSDAMLAGLASRLEKTHA